MKQILVLEKIKDEWTFAPYWAVRPMKGNTLGKRFIEPFKQDVKNIVDRGCEDKGKKMSAAQMQEKLRTIYPNRFDITGTHNITRYVTSCLIAIRASSNGLGGTSAPQTKIRYYMPRIMPQHLRQSYEQTLILILR